MSFKHDFAIFGPTFVIALAVITAFRLSEQATAAVVRVICGAMASIPMSTLVLVAPQRFSKRQQVGAYAAQPPVVIVNHGALGTPAGSPMLPTFNCPGNRWNPAISRSSATRRGWRLRMTSLQRADRRF